MPVLSVVGPGRGLLKKRITVECIDQIREIISDRIEAPARTSFYTKMSPFWFPFDEWLHGVDTPGVYLIGDFYVGESKRIKSRLKQHFGAYKRQDPLSGHINKSLQSWHGYRVPVFFLSENQSDEYRIAKELIESGFPLVNQSLSNCSGFSDLLKERYELDAIAFLARKGYTIIPPSNETL